ncbi:CatB-related O-acetyltransferase [Hydrogenophaga sp.]|uniref:CatB-related O-acetyltransferase n=1 Tax=Hydrogenophaga sp. TaxID=1904254 RepID=UPI00286E0466|nr:CatB-related O-acetyltransferase [Hydrogenophaga sp.]
MRYPEHQIGIGTYGDLTVYSWGERAKLSVGNYTSIAAGVKVFLGGEHRIDWVTTFPFNVLMETARHHTGHPKTKGDVLIGSDVWIGTDALIFSGVTIGDGAVIGARAVVTRDVAPYAVVAGNPASLIKFRFDEATIERLIKLKWWSWPQSQLEKAMPDMLSQKVHVFLEKAERKEYQ